MGKLRTLYDNAHDAAALAGASENEAAATAEHVVNDVAAELLEQDDEEKEG